MSECNIAVIMSVYRYDNPEMFKVAVNSILEQSISCDLLIYRDGPVSSELDEVLDSYSLLSNVIIFRNNENNGLATSLNFLISFSLEKGYQYIARMDSDDISRPDRLRRQVLFLENNSDVDVLGASCHEFGASFALYEKHLPINHEELMNFSITRCPFIHPTVIFRRDVFEEGYRYPVDTTLTEDMALWFELLNAGFKFANINEVLLDYRLNENTINRRKGISKALSEINIRLRNMISLKQVNYKNVLLIAARIVFHLMPDFLIKVAYKKAR
jgi:glycosyltransferase involved in cell wall biosynthesis